jgi:predicted GNAT superfamily acetyltransferase
MLKLAQRDDALARGIRLMEWTFDPLELKNAYFNMERLGAVVKRYVLNQYGVTSSKLHGGLPTDRCVAEWYLDSARVRAILAGQPEPRPEILARIYVPGNIDVLRQENPSQLREIQQRVTSEFLELFRQGLTVVGVERDAAGGGHYLLSHWEP